LILLLFLRRRLVHPLVKQVDVYPGTHAHLRLVLADRKRFVGAGDSQADSARVKPQGYQL